MNLSDKQSAILDFLISYQDQYGYPPSVREIGDAVDLRSTSSVHAQLAKLEEKGYIRRHPSKSRTIEICRGKETSPLSQQGGKVVPFQDPNQNLPELAALPILGRVRAGEPVLAVENIEDYFAVPVDVTGNSDCFMLRVQGESMINAGILEGDLIIVRSQKTAQNGDIVVALLGDSVTVKRFFKEKDYIRLQPENDYMEPILVKDCSLLGKVVGLFRRM